MLCVYMSVFKTTQTQWKEDDQTEKLGCLAFFLFLFFFFLLGDYCFNKCKKTDFPLSLINLFLRQDFRNL